MAQPSPFLAAHEQLSSENNRDDVSTHVGVDGGVLVQDNTFKEPASNASPEAAVTSPGVNFQDAQRLAPPRDPVEVTTSTPPASTEVSASESSTPTSTHVFNTGKYLSATWLDKKLILAQADRYTLRRSNSVPASPSTPRTEASSDTLNSTPTHSNTSFSPSLAKFRQVVDEHKRSSGKCHQALAEHLKDEEKNIENAEWAAIVEWTKATHQAEMVNLKKDHAAVVEELLKERSRVRRLLELKTRDFRAIKRELTALKKSIEEAAKDQEEKQPASNSQSADDSGAESVDQDEGGVLLAQDNAATTKMVHDKREKFSDIPQQVGEAGDRMRTANQGMKQAKVSKKETAEEKETWYQALMQQLMDGSTPEAHFEAEAGPSTATQKATAIVHHTKSPFNEVKELHVHNKALQALGDVISNMKVDAEAREEEIKTLKAENHFAQLEIGHCHAANACYRHELDDENPARTAHLDGLLKCKDDAYAELEERANECAELLAEEKKERAIEKEHSEAEIRGMHKELAHRFKVIETLTEGKAVLKAQNDWVYQMFQGKIFHDDILEAFNRDYFAIQKDNALLIKTIGERQCYFLDAEKEVADLKAGKIVDDHVAHAEYLKHRQTLQSLNGLTYINHQLNAKVDIVDEMREELKKNLEDQIKDQTADLQAIMESSADDWLMERQEAQEREIDLLNSKITEANGVAHQWRIQALEQADGFCPLNDFPEVGDFNAEQVRWRLVEAERQVVNLQQVVREMDRERKGKGKEVEGKGKGKEREGKGKGKEREGNETEGKGKGKEIEGKGKGKEKKVLEIGHDGSNWLKDRTDAERVREKFRWME